MANSAIQTMSKQAHASPRPRSAVPPRFLAAPLRPRSGPIHEVRYLARPCADGAGASNSEPRFRIAFTATLTRLFVCYDPGWSWESLLQ